MPKARVCSLFVMILSLSMGGMLYARDQKPLDYVLKVSIDVHSSKIQGVASIRLKAGEKIVLQKGPLLIHDVRLGAKSLEVRREEGVMPITASRADVLRISYEGIFNPQRATVGAGHPEQASLIDEKAVSLTGIWYPRVGRLCRYRLEANLPTGFEAVSEAEIIHKHADDGKTVFTFQFPHPLDEMTLVASNQYVVTKGRFAEVDILAYFFPEDAGLAPTYIERTKEYLNLYQELLGPYPYRRFSIVENVLPTGYSMPTFTLLGRDVVRLPFIPETSLGHEVLHQWFGNLVYIDYAKGNWAEGLTTYLADHLFEARKNGGPAYRKALLIDYQSYVHEENEFPLADFRGRTDDASKAIGYGKAAMVFHMLEKHLGDEAFLRSLRHFIRTHRHSRASWEDLQEAFEKESRKNLTRFFRQWVHEKGLPHFSPEGAESKQKDGAWEADIVLVQWERPYILDVPLTISWSAGREKSLVHVENGRTRVAISSENQPGRIALDDEYDVARRLSRREFPPVIARVLGCDKTLLVPSATGAERYKEVADAFLQRGAILKEIPTDTDLAGACLILLGQDNPVTQRLFGTVTTEGGFSIAVKENPLNPVHVAATIRADSNEEAVSAFGKIFHYGGYSHVAFERGVNISKAIDKTENGVTRELASPPKLDQPTFDAVQRITRQIMERKIIYIGEAHDQLSHHLVELETIKALHRQGRTIAIGMEMFQRPVQPALDNYIAGRTDERQFLKQSEYFKSWGFDYNLYRPILEFARSEGIPVVALNLDHETVSKVSLNGLDSLSPEEKAAIPAQLDLSDKAYEERLKKIFLSHETAKERQFKFFYQAQVLWDETMAESVDTFLKKHPAYQMVVLAGSGHLAHGYGIPNRVARRNGFDHAIMLTGTDLEKGSADYILSPRQVAYAPAPKLMLFLTEDTGKVTIQSFPQDSISEKAGLKVGDAIMSIDGTPIRTIDDGKIVLFFHKNGDKVKVRVLRKELPGVSKELDFEITL